MARGSSSLPGRIATNHFEYATRGAFGATSRVPLLLFVHSGSGDASGDTLVVTPEDSFARAERYLVETGEHQRLRDARMFVQYGAQGTFREAVERITGRTVRGFVSGGDVEPDISTEVFYLQSEE